jgi:hypothetical protein
VANLISARSSKVFLLPEWSAWMAEEHFYLTRYPPEKKKACAFVFLLRLLSPSPALYRSSTISEDIHQKRKRGRGLAAAWAIEVITGKRRTPARKCSDQLAWRNVRFYGQESAGPHCSANLLIR